MGLKLGKGALHLMVAMMCIPSLAQLTPKETVEQMIAREKASAEKRWSYIFTATERSDRTGGHLWTERVVETPFGRVRRLLTEDGKPLPPERVQQERDRLASDAAHPDAFIKREKTNMADEAHGRQILELLTRAFILENMRTQDGEIRIDFRPDPAYSPSGSEEKIMHGMSGYLLIDRRELRLRYIEGRLPTDMSIGFGFVNVKEGSFFVMQKAPVAGQWRTMRLVSDVRAKAVLLKSISRNQNVERRDFEHVPDNLTVPQAVALAEK